jgi:hypothetical protein
LKGHVASFFFLFYNFNNAGIVTNEIFKIYVQDKRIFALFFQTKRYKKGIDGGKWERKLKKLLPTLTTLP